MSAVPGGGVQIGPTPLGAVRRTTTIVIEPRGTWAEGQTVTATGRDLTRAPDDVVRAEHDELALDLDASGAIAPRDPGGLPTALHGQSVRRGLRKKLAELYQEPHGDGEALGPAGGLYAAMLDDVVGASLASGYGRLQEESVGPTVDLATHMSSTCLGFSTMHARGEMFDVERYFDTKQPSIDFVPADALAWHDDRPVRPRSFRRRRMLQVAPTGDGRIAVTGYFRDTFMAADGVEMVVHEYGLDATVSGPELTLDSIEASPGLLPLDHCPLAAVTATRLEGLPLPQVEVAVRRDIVGPTGCTHLNDELRNLRLVPTLLALLTPQEVRSAHTRR